MFEIRSLVKLRKDLEILIEEVKGLVHKSEPQKEQVLSPSINEKTGTNAELEAKIEPQPDKNQQSF